ncbi:MAG TPA: phosphoribosylformylglycinamidine synthase subunit PurQ [Thermoanaerobaculia bacterium]|nr:phosphoribosylformylglycinamidine synthase subunit PurQ [Thermoanaerobaculia bacterium]
MRAGVVVFPGSNCDHDVYHVLAHVLAQPVDWLWHESSDAGGCDLIVLPGGFSYGDYLRAGAMAALSPVMAAVRRHADRGGLVLGICNGFQILLESGLLPGAMLRNRDLRFSSRDVHVRVERNDLPFTRCCEVGQVLRMPIAHAEGNYVHSEAELDRLEANRQVVFTYVDPRGALDDAANPNGSARAIAGICNEAGNVCALMPHPERAAEAVLGNVAGLWLFQSLLAGVAAGVGAGAAEVLR